MECPKCHANNSDDAVFCSLCFETFKPKTKPQASPSGDLAELDRQLSQCAAKLGLRRDEALSERARALGLGIGVYELLARPGFVYPMMCLGGNNFAMEEIGATRAESEEKLKTMADKRPK